MPVYEFQCNRCNSKFEEYFKSSTEQKKIFCPSCQSGRIQKIFSVFGTHDTSNGNTPVTNTNNKADGCGCCATG